jgi:UDP-3-O-[3-hydroxymyristoyl] glucosamine N-acyltransferase
VHYTVAEIARMVDGAVEGNSEKVIYGVAGLQEATEDQITFAVPPYLDYIHLAKAGAIVVPKDAVVTAKIPLIRVENPRGVFALLSSTFNPAFERAMGIHPSAFVDPTAEVDPAAMIMALAYVGPRAKIGKGTLLYPHSYVGDEAVVGEDCILYPNAVVQQQCELGDRVILQPGAVIGADGFGFTLVDGAHRKVPQVGKVILGDDVEVGANSTIDRGTLGDTVIGSGTKMDNLVHLGHNAQVGDHCLFVAFSGISGSTKIGKYCTFGGQSATKGHITIGDNCMFGGRSGIIRDIPSGSVMSGFPLQPHREWLRKETASLQVPELLKRVQVLEKKLAQQEKP